MEGPSLYLAQKKLAPFKGQAIGQVSGNSTIGIERLRHERIKDIFSWGKHLVFQFDTFALRVHFMLFGTFEATIDGQSVTGDYKEAQTPRLALVLPNGHIEMYSCSLRYLEEKRAKKTYDFSADVMARQWNPERALEKVRRAPAEEIGDVLLDQDIFAGVGNIIRNEILFLAGIHPEARVKDIPLRKLRELIRLAREFSFQFYRWRKRFVLRKNLVIYQRSTCPGSETKIIRKITGKRARRSYICPECQKLP
jgi:endonuclease-8